MRRQFESADPLRRGGARRPGAATQGRPRTQAGPAGLPTQAPQESTKPGPVRPQVPAAAAQNQSIQPPAQIRAGAAPGPSQPQLTGLGNTGAADAEGYDEVPLRCCSREELMATRFHMLRFHSRQPVDPSRQFVPPVRMHRKDPRQLQVTAGMPDPGAMEVDDPDAGPDGSGEAGGGQQNDEPRPKKSNQFWRRRKTHQVQGGERNEAARRLRYEEHFPWILEDFENKNTWVSSYEAAQSDAYAVLASDGQGGYKLIPVEKWYRMTPNARYATLSLEDAEERMERSNQSRDRWLMEHLQPRSVERPVHEPGGGRGSGGLRTVIGGEEKPRAALEESLDYDEQEMFDDDEGAPIMEGPDDEIKDAEDRIKREQRQANQLIGEQDADLDDLFGDDAGSGDGGVMDRQGRKLRKALRSLEKNQFYDSDDDENPYASDQDASSDSDTAADTQTAQGPGDTDPATLRQELLPLVSSFKKRVIRGLPPGMAVLQLPPPILSKFPKGEWNPGLKPTYPMPVPTAPTTAPAAPAGGTESAASSSGEPPEDQLLQESEVRSHIVSGQTSVKDLVTALGPQLLTYPQANRKRLREILLKVAHISDEKKLFLR